MWRRLAREAHVVPEEPALFMPVRVTNSAAHRESGVGTTKRKAPAAASRTIEVTIADATMRVPAGADADTLEALITALRQSR